jgi:glycosyltransferase involved in cell wall biosynthesis
MAAAVLALLDDHERRDRLSRQARRFVEENMSARRAAQAFEQICLRAMELRSKDRLQS